MAEGSRMFGLQQATSEHRVCSFLLGTLQNFSERQIVWSLCLVVFHALTLKLPIQTSLSVVSKLPLSLSSAEKLCKFQ